MRDSIFGDPRCSPGVGRWTVLQSQSQLRVKVKVVPKQIFFFTKTMVFIVKNLANKATTTILNPC